MPDVLACGMHKGRKEMSGMPGGWIICQKISRIAEIISGEVQDYDVRYEKKVFSRERRMSTIFENVSK